MYKKILIIAFSIALSSMPFFAGAELLPCDDLEGIVEALDKLADNMEEVEPGDISAESDEDMGLGELSKALKQIVIEEDNDGLANAAEVMYSVWDTDGPWTAGQLA
jgi:hypothetical protein